MVSDCALDEIRLAPGGDLGKFKYYPSATRVNQDAEALTITAEPINR